MASDKASARYLAELALQHGIEDAVLCHGSRNAPLILSFNRQEGIRTHPLADERAAAFYALGMAQKSGRPAIVNCSSGTAALNMAPAAAEAYYQRIPLVLVTADRPDEWIDQMDGQTIRQERVFEPHVRRSVQLALEAREHDALWHVERSINEALNASRYPVPGPVHINVPFREPLYGEEREEPRVPEAFMTVEHSTELSDRSLLELKRDWEGAERVMLIAGSGDPDEERDRKLELLIREKGLTVLSETLSNLDVPSALSHIDRTLMAIPDGEESAHAPDLLISMGGALVSKKLKAFLRAHPPKRHWRIDPYGEAIDTYQSLSRILPVRPEHLFEKLLTWGTSEKRKAFKELWQEKASRAASRYREHLDRAPWSDLLAFEKILHGLPEGSELQAGNSSPVRYLQLIERRADLLHRGNRGTSGIDGVISTAAGASSRSEKHVTVITGDIGFFYDSNALWNPALPSTLRIIVINNGGGGIFRIIDGPADTRELEPYFEGVHEMDASGISHSFGLPYYFCEDDKGLEEGLEKLFAEEGPAVLEVFTPRTSNDQVLREHFEHLHHQNPSS